MGSGPGLASPTPAPATIHVRLPITLGQFLKVAGVADTGGDAKLLVATGQVSVNAVPETRRGRHLQQGDVVTAPSHPPLVVAEGSVSPA